MIGRKTMINWLSEIIIPFTLCAGLLLICRYFWLANYGPAFSYFSWLLIPASLIVPFVELPNWFAAVGQGQPVQYYLVTEAHTNAQVGITAILQYAWLLGTGVLLGYWLVQHLLLIKRLSNWQQIDLPEKMSKCNSLTAYQSSDISSPMLVGLFRTKLLLPTDFKKLFTKEQQELILEHELCHYQRGDLIWNALALIILALLWFHPLSWLAFFRFCRDQELSCDQAVLARKHTSSRINYGKALVIAAESSPPQGFAQLSFKEYGDKHVMFERIDLIKRNPTGSKLLILLVIAVAISLLSAMSYAGSDDKQAKHRKPPTAKEAISPVYRVEPKYPEKAVAENIEGAVVLKYDVDTDGKVINVEVMSGQPAYVFDRVAVTALKQWKYKKLTSVSKNNLVQLDFRLDKDSSYENINLIEKIKVTQ